LFAWLSVFLGIQLLSAELKKLNDKHNVEETRARTDTSETSVQSILKDISESCSTAIEILNDLLLIDKIEEGNLNLDMNLINAKELIGPCIQNFDVQVSNYKAISCMVLYHSLTYSLTHSWFVCCGVCRPNSPTLTSQLTCTLSEMSL
jgi:signal transduction histidine kinase